MRYLTEERHCDPLCKDTNDITGLTLAAAMCCVDILRYFVEERGYGNKVKEMTSAAI